MIQDHLDKGCATCSEAFATWLRVADFAAHEREYQPPEHAARTVKGLMAIHGRPPRASVAALLFDSVRRPSLVGVRSAANAPRQMLYGVDNYRIDLRLETKTGSDAISLVGQILISGMSHGPLGQTEVALLKGRRIVSTSRTNQLGEFHLECEMAQSLRLQFVLPEGKIIRTPTIELLEPAATNTDFTGTQY